MGSVVDLLPSAEVDVGACGASGQQVSVTERLQANEQSHNDEQEHINTDGAFFQRTQGGCAAAWERSR